MNYPKDGTWCFVKISDDWFPAKRDSSRAGGWTNDDTWEDFTCAVSDFKIIAPLQTIDEQNLVKVSEFPPKQGQVSAVWASKRWHIAIYSNGFWDAFGDQCTFKDVEIYVPLLSSPPNEFIKSGTRMALYKGTVFLGGSS